MKKIKAGIIGCGTIGGVIADAIVNRFSAAVSLVALCDADERKAKGLSEKLGIKASILGIGDLIKISDLVIEAASGSISYKIAEDALMAGKDVMVMSTGGLLGKGNIFELAKKKGAKIYLPSGAICGLDGIKSAMMAGVKRVTLTTRKPLAGLEGAPYIVEKKIDLKSVKKETVIFEGTAEEAVRGFPMNVNVSATLSLCGIGAKATKVRIVTSPEYKTNSHEVEAEGDFGSLKAITDNFPMPNNPKTSYLAALSAVATIENIISSKTIGN